VREKDVNGKFETNCGLGQQPDGMTNEQYWTARETARVDQDPGEVETEDLDKPSEGKTRRSLQASRYRYLSGRRC